LDGKKSILRYTTSYIRNSLKMLQQMKTSAADMDG